MEKRAPYFLQFFVGVILIYFLIQQFTKLTSPKLEVISIIVTIIGILVTIWSVVKSAQLIKDQKTINWESLKTITKSLAVKIKRSTYKKPNIIYAINEKDGIIATLLNDGLGTNIPIITGFQTPIFNPQDPDKYPGYKKVKINKWNIYVPDILFSYSNKKILIVHDCTISGEYIRCLKDFFAQNKFILSKIKFLCILSSKVSKTNNSEPDYYEIECETTDYYFPWGKVE